MMQYETEYTQKQAEADHGLAGSDLIDASATIRCDRIREFLNAQHWIFAKTFELTWPHEYILRNRVTDMDMFNQTIELLRTRGYAGTFYSRSITYFDLDGMTYWEMGNKSVEDTVVINRCRKELSYESRKAAGTLPPPRGTPFGKGLQSFLLEGKWTSAHPGTMAGPSESMIRDQVDENLFVALVRHIRICGCEGKLQRRTINSFDHEGMVYWAGSSLLKDTTVVNRTPKKHFVDACRNEDARPS